MAILNDLLVKFEDNEVKVLVKLSDGSLVNAPDPIVLNIEDGDRIRWSFSGLKLEILFGSNVVNSGLRALAESGSRVTENTPFTTDTFLAAGNGVVLSGDTLFNVAENEAAPADGLDFNLNGAIFPPPIEPPLGNIVSQDDWEEDDFKYTINLTDVDGVLHTLDPHVRRRRLRRMREEL